MHNTSSVSCCERDNHTKGIAQKRDNTQKGNKRRSKLYIRISKRGKYILTSKIFRSDKLLTSATSTELIISSTEEVGIFGLLLLRGELREAAAAAPTVVVLIDSTIAVAILFSLVAGNLPSVSMYTTQDRCGDGGGGGGGGNDCCGNEVGVETELKAEVDEDDDEEVVTAE